MLRQAQHEREMATNNLTKIQQPKIIPKAILHRSKMVARRRPTKGEIQCISPANGHPSLTSFLI
jgi:hypothetical protein